MRALKLLPLARRRCLMAAPATPPERLPDAASFYEPPRGGAEAEMAEGRPWQSETVTRIGPKE
ncbi:hypothetical protein EJV46_03010 [Roseococcus sp. SYP-B2431]|uniref:hypothetical protein n=1 Tax=Roseococcus sp. SYP-B2431 TaxID=2496640 RepID=UPI00103EE8B1|nr:hypothetical protein [Roseococcus sp. SYP-B2431]TCH99660.1 hypothetical protein EJV46_03010 [Roseococcus sp. SYP-B2431]